MSELCLVLATWFERRLHDTVPFAMNDRRVYGLEVVDPEALELDGPSGARVPFVGSNPLPVELLSFDAFATLEYEWREVAPLRPRRPFEFPQRRRARVVAVGMLGSLATVVRFEHQPELVLCSFAA